MVLGVLWRAGGGVKPNPWQRIMRHRHLTSCDSRLLLAGRGPELLEHVGESYPARKSPRRQFATPHAAAERLGMEARKSGGLAGSS